MVVFVAVFLVFEVFFEKKSVLFGLVDLKSSSESESIFEKLLFVENFVITALQKLVVFAKVFDGTFDAPAFDFAFPTVSVGTAEDCQIH